MESVSRIESISTRIRQGIILFQLKKVAAYLIWTAAAVTYLLNSIIPLSAGAIPNNPKAPSAEPAENQHWTQIIDSSWGGRLKSTGRASWPNNDSIYAPVGSGTLFDGSVNLRLINDTFISSWGHFKFHNETFLAAGDTIRKFDGLGDLFPGLPEDTLPGAPFDDDRRLLDLSWTISEGNSYRLLNRVDRLNLAVIQPWGTIRIGRQALTWGNGKIFNPMDLFNPFAPTQIDRDYKVGDDMVTGQFAVDRISGDLQLVYVARRNPETNTASFSQSSVGGKMHFATGETEFDALAAKHYEDYVLGVGGRGYIGNAGWNIDATWTFLRDDDVGSQNDYLSLAADVDYSWVWWGKNFYGLIEFFFNGLGENTYSDALLNPAITERLSRGELFAVGRYYLSGEIQIELHPLFKVFCSIINNLNDPSGILQPRAIYDVAQNLQLIFGANIAYGAKDTEFGGYKIPDTDIRTRPADNVYAWLIYYF
jgi:hypothetical protein